MLGEKRVKWSEVVRVKERNGGIDAVMLENVIKKVKKNDKSENEGRRRGCGRNNENFIKAQKKRG